VVGSSRSCSRPAVPASVCTWRTVRLVGTDSPRGASWLGVLRVHHVFLSVFVSIRLARCFWPVVVWRIVRLDVAVACGPSEDRAQTVHYSRCATRGSASFFGPSIRDPWTVRPYHTNRPSGHCGLSAWCLAELRSPLLFEFRFHFGIVLGLFLGLVGPL
jgi:hypothetical protein